MGLLEWARHFSGRQVVRGEDQLFSFGGIVEEEASDSDVPAGTAMLSGEAVPAGEIWVVTQVRMRYEGTAPNSLLLATAGLAGNIALLFEGTVTSGDYYAATVNALLQEGDYVMLVADGATAGDNMGMAYSGYKMTLEAL